MLPCGASPEVGVAHVGKPREWPSPWGASYARGLLSGLGHSWAIPMGQSLFFKSIPGIWGGGGTAEQTGEANAGRGRPGEAKPLAVQAPGLA